MDRLRGQNAAFLVKKTTQMEKEDAQITVY